MSKLIDTSLSCRHRIGRVALNGWRMPANLLENPEYWRFRAEEVRTIADDMRDSEPKKIMLRIAADYERIAIFFEQPGRDEK